MTLPISEAKPIVVFFSPVMPALTGEGRAIRAYNWVVELEHKYQVVVVVLGMPQSISNDLKQLAVTVFFVKPTIGFYLRVAKLSALFLPFLCRVNPRLCSDWPKIANHSHELLALQSFLAGRVVYKLLIFRLYLHGAGDVLKTLLQPVNVELDCDDWESDSRLSLMQAALKLRMPANAMLEFGRYLQYRFIERQVMQSYDRVYLACSDDIKPDVSSKFLYRPNKVSLPVKKAMQKSVTDDFKVIFVGTLNYLPNIEAIQNVLLPLADLLLKHFGGTIRLIIAGRNPPRKILKRLLAHPMVEIHENVPDLSLLYQQADLALVPVRFGGGTKIKTIEAFANKVPVVSTLHGVRGLSTKIGVHYYAAETVIDFYNAICLLQADNYLRQELSEAAWELYCTNLNVESVNETLANQD